MKRIGNVILVILAVCALYAQDADHLFEEATSQYSSSRFMDAHLTYKQAQELYLGEGDMLKVADCFSMIGACFIQMGREYKPLYEQAEQIYDSMGIPTSTLRLLS